MATYSQQMWQNLDELGYEWAIIGQDDEMADALMFDASGFDPYALDQSLTSGLYGAGGLVQAGTDDDFFSLGL